MCLQHSAVRPYQKWNWAGNEIIQNTALPVNKTIVANGKKIHRYDIDIREFLSIEKNAVIRKLINQMISKLSTDAQLRFHDSDYGNRDFRVKCCQEYLKHFTYCTGKGGHDSWQYPEETIILKSGDCEDLAFLLASMIEACDISPYCIRVALGNVINHDSLTQEPWDHAWVMYMNESGAWQIIEPVQYVRYETPKITAKARAQRLHDVEYVPHYVFNKDHLWLVRSNDSIIRESFLKYVVQRKYFNKFHPSFAASVHADIFDAALPGVSWFNMQRIKITSLYLDANTATYDPRDHFDFAYIPESWNVVQRRLGTGDLADFAMAAHAIADFYAHSMYGYFAMDKTTKKLEIYDPAKPYPDPATLQYDFTNLGQLKNCSGDAVTAAAYWTGKKQLISGQWDRWFASIPDSLQKKPDFKNRQCLPDHDAIAVDGPNLKKGKHLLFNETDYKDQFKARKDAAIRHIKKAYRTGGYNW